MADNSNEWDTWVADTKRRGELAVTVGATALFTWLAAALPTASQTHVDIWPPVAVALFVVAVGIYAWVALERTLSTQGDIKTRSKRERRWWLPGKVEAVRRAEIAGKWAKIESDVERRTGGTVESDALNRIGDLLEKLLERLPESDAPTQR